MHAPVQDQDVVADGRLAPAGLTQLLGAHGTHRRGAVLGLATALSVVAAAAVLLVPAPSAWVGAAFFLPVALIASEMGMRTGLAWAALCATVIIASPASGWAAQGPSAVLPRSLALLFLALVAGRVADHTFRSRHLLRRSSKPRPTRSTSRTAMAATCSSTAPRRSSSATPPSRSSATPTRSCCCRRSPMTSPATTPA